MILTLCLTHDLQHPYPLFTHKNSFIQLKNSDKKLIFSSYFEHSSPLYSQQELLEIFILGQTQFFANADANVFDSAN